MRIFMNYSKFSILSLSHLDKICRFSIALFVIALSSADLAQAAPTAPLNPSAPQVPFPIPTGVLPYEVTSECKALMTTIKDMKYVNMTHATINNINGKQSGGYSLWPNSLVVNNGVASGLGQQLLSDRLVQDPNAANENRIFLPSQPFDFDRPEQISYSIDLATAKITLQNTNYQITSCQGGKFAVVSTGFSVEAFSFTQGYDPTIPPIVN
jgi:hypothetical protein